MAFHFRFGPADLLRCRFAISPRWETQEAVRVLLRPQRQAYHLPWLSGIRSAAAGLDLRPLWLLMPRAGHNPDLLSPPPAGPSVTFEEELDRVRAAAGDPDAAREDLRRALVCTPGAAESDIGRRMLADPARAVRELADLYERAWEVLIAPHWPRLRALLEADVLFHSRRLAAGGLQALFDGLHSDLRWSGQDQTLVLERPSRHDRELGGQGLLLMPSAFVWPEAVGGYDPPWQPTLVYPARGIGALWAAAAGPAPRALAGLLGRTRAEVLCALREPASTTALAHRLGLAPSTVSAHLKALRAAGLLLPCRQGHQVLYERTPLGIALISGGAPAV
ncbi:DUF5937 family protein [Streptomyces sp. NPDC012794]|uniref:ArsR/SmtB family transcription factor n=1 Tax=Streptomyces sp. NPDC012794 TaxID=3364850 RepID=UPI0036B458E7